MDLPQRACWSTTCWEESLIVDDGWMRAPAGSGSHGLGIVIDRRAVARFRVEAAGRTP